MSHGVRLTLAPKAKDSPVSDLKTDLASLRIDHDRPARSPWRWPLLLLVPVIVLLAVLYALRARQAFSAVEVEVGQATMSAPAAPGQAGAPILTASGYVVARRKAVVSAKVQGRLGVLKVEEGDRVREGAVIARLEADDVAAQVQRARAMVQRAEADLAEQRRLARQAADLVREKVLAGDQLEAADSRVKMAEAALRQAHADLSLASAQLQNTVILAPFTGTVVKKMAEVGESVAPIPPGVNLSTSSGAIVALADLDTLEVEADVAEANVAKLSDEQPAEVTVEAFPDRRYRAVLRQVIPTADRTKATVQVKVTILDKDPNLKPEMSAKVTFLEPARPVAASAPATPTVVVPRDAVVTREGETVVFVVGSDGKVQRRPVTTRGESQGQLIVRSGLSGGESVVVRPPETLRAGDAVRQRKG
jgi:RND family efflux transporter MFP subunit